MVAVIDSRTDALLDTSRDLYNISDITMRNYSFVFAVLTIVAGASTLFVAGYALTQSTSSNTDGGSSAESTVV